MPNTNPFDVSCNVQIKITEKTSGVVAEGEGNISGESDYVARSIDEVMQKLLEKLFTEARSASTTPRNLQ